MNKLAAACTLSLVLTACGGVSSTGGVMSAKKETGYFGMEKDAIAVDTAKAFAGNRDVVIGGFLVGYDIKSGDSKKAGGGLMGSGFGGKSSAKVELTGVSNETLQQITDKAYADFVADLKAQGYNVVDRSGLLSSSEFKDTSKEKNPYVNTSGGFLTAAAETRYFAPSSFGETRFFLGDLGPAGGGFGFSNPTVAAAQFAGKDGAPRVLHVRYVVDFANTSGHGSWATNTSSLQVGQGLSVAAGSSVGIIGGQMSSFSNNVGKISLGQPIDSDKEFGQVVDITSGADEAGQVAANVLGVIGGLGTNSSRKYEVQADSGKYAAAADEALAKTNDTLIAEMVKLK